MWDLGSLIWISALIIVFEDGDLGDTCGQTKSIHNQSARPDLPILSHCCSVTTLPHSTTLHLYWRRHITQCKNCKLSSAENAHCSAIQWRRRRSRADRRQAVRCSPIPAAASCVICCPHWSLHCIVISSQSVSPHTEKQTIYYDLLNYASLGLFILIATGALSPLEGQIIMISSTKICHLFIWKLQSAGQLSWWPAKSISLLCTLSRPQ